MGTTISWHFEKHAVGAVNGLQRHNERDAEQHKNERIDPERSQNNINAVEPDMIGKTYQQRIKTRLDEFYTGKRAPRKDAIVDVQHSIQFGGDVFNELPGEKRLEVMQTASEFIIQRIGGRKNVLDLNYHRDETSDHVHMDTIPLLNDGRLSAKELYSRQFMKETQADLLSFMQERFPELEFERADKMGRGFENGRSQADFERLSDERRLNEEKYEQQQKELTEAQRALNRDRKNQALDILEIAEPDMQVPKAEYIKRLEQSDNHAKFFEKYGARPFPLSEPQGRNQLFSWASADWLVDKAKKAWKLVKERLDRLARREKYVEQKDRDLHLAEANMYFDVIEQIDGFERSEETRLERIADTERVVAEQHERAKRLIANGRDENDPAVKFSAEDKPANYYRYELNEAIEENITKPKEMLADVAISLGVHKSWRETMIKKGGVIGRTTDGETLDEPFSELIPERLQQATVEQLQFAVANIQRNQNRNQGFGRGR